MLKGKLKAEILNEPDPQWSIDMIGSAAYYDVYVVNEHEIPIVYFRNYKKVDYQYNSSTQQTTEIIRNTTNEARVYVGFDILTQEGISQIELIADTNITWIESLA